MTGAVARHRASIRSFANMRNLDVWYARTEFDSAFDELKDRVNSSERKRAEKAAAKALQKDHKAFVKAIKAGRVEARGGI